MPAPPRATLHAEPTRCIAPASPVATSIRTALSWIQAQEEEASPAADVSPAAAAAEEVAAEEVALPEGRPMRRVNSFTRL